MTDSVSTKMNLPQRLFEGLKNLSALITAITIVISAITFLPNQQKQERNQIQKNQIDTDRSHYEAWNVINNNKVQASSSRITALQNLAKDRVSLNGLEVPGAFLFSIDLGGADLYRANFQGSDLYLADFSSKPKQNNPFIRCSIFGFTQFFDCKSEQELQERRTELERVDFKGAILYEVKFNDKDPQDKESKEPDVDLFRADFRPLYLTKNPEKKALYEQDKQECSTKYSNDNKDRDRTECLTEKLIEKECDANDPIIQCTRAVNAEFIGANLKYADFTKANLKGANFTDANLECASFRGAIFNSVETEDPNITNKIVKPTDFTNANLKGADLRDLATPTKGDPIRDISPEQIKKAKNWEQAKYSDSFLEKLGLSKQNHKPFDCKSYQKESL
jgi:uncharacterized protein YjbI with pentapeptide repeats